MAGGAPRGNTNAKTGTEWREAIRWALAQPGPNGIKKVRQCALSLVNKAAEGDVAALKEMGDRTDGKALQTILGPGEDGEHTLIHKVEEVIIDPES